MTHEQFETAKANRANYSAIEDILAGVFTEYNDGEPPTSIPSDVVVAAEAFIMSILPRITDERISNKIAERNAAWLNNLYTDLNSLLETLDEEFEAIANEEEIEET